jgi:hypothetical protein
MEKGSYLCSLEIPSIKSQTKHPSSRPDSKLLVSHFGA